MTGPTDYSRIAPHYDDVREMPQENIDRWISALTKHGRIEKQSNVLEIGAGTGRFAIPLEQQTASRITALDLSQDMLKLAKAKTSSGSIGWVRSHAESLPFLDSTFNCVFMIFTLQHIENRPEALQEIYRVLRPRGRVVIGTASHGQFKRDIVCRYFPNLLTVDLARFPAIPKLKAMLETQGFDDINNHHVRGKPRYLSKKGYLDWIRHKPLSTFTMLKGNQYQEGLAKFTRAKLNKKIREHFVYYECVYVIGTKPNGRVPEHRL